MVDVHSSVRAATQSIITLLQGPHRQPGEAVVRQVVVLRLLQAAGWDIWNPDAVMPEETNPGGRRPDFLLRAGPQAFALELKGMNVSLGQPEAQQAVTYAGSVGVRWAVLTSGRVWAFFDEALPGPFHEREVLRVEFTLSDPEPFASDFAALLGEAVWRAGGFEAAVDTVRQRQADRQERARVLQERRPEVLAFQREYEIGSFESAVRLYAAQGQISETERDILLGRSAEPPAQAPRASAPAAKHQPLLVPEVKTAAWGRVVEFHYRVLQATATARYDPRAGSWTVLKGSTALERQTNTAAGQRFARQRERLIQEGTLKRTEQGFVFLRDTSFRSPSAAALMVSGYPQSGWEVWKDAQGHSAQKYRPAATR